MVDESVGKIQLTPFWLFVEGLQLPQGTYSY